MSKLTRREKNDRKKNAQALSVNTAGWQGGRVNPLCAVPDCDDVSVWPRDFSDMAERIERDRPSMVPNRDRDLLAVNAPRGAFTRRDGTSIRPRYRDLANA